jgi:hypothetical protein
MIERLITRFVVWMLHRLGFWWFNDNYKREEDRNTFSQGRQLLFWRRDPETDEWRGTATVSWYLGRRAGGLHAHFTFAGQEDPYKIAISIPRLFALYLSTDMIRPFWDRKADRWQYSRRTGFYVHHSPHHSISIDFLSNDHDRALKHKKIRRQWYIDIDRIVFGKQDCHSHEWRAGTTVVRMDGREHPAVVKHRMMTWTWKRFRSPRVRAYTEIDLDSPPMFAGKGENAHDMDDDGIFSASYDGIVPVDRVADLYIADVLDYRAKYGLPTERSIAV